MVSKDDQKVLAFPGRRLHGLTANRGRCTMNQVMEGFIGNEARYFRRGDIEEDPSWKQVIPYVVVRYGDQFVFRYRRGTDGGEPRLHGDWSIGLGGHIEEEDQTSSTKDTIRLAARREVAEEVWVPPGDINTLECVGWVYSDENPVSSVHFGVVFECRLSLPKCLPQEKCITLPGWVTLAEGLAGAGSVLAVGAGYELWSALTLKLLANIQ